MGCVTSRILEPLDSIDAAASVSSVSPVVSSSDTTPCPSVTLTDTVIIDPHLQKEAAKEANHNVVFDFTDVIDEKHIKYMDRYVADEEFWGIGIENETYLTLPERHGAAEFRRLTLKPERYSVTYTTNFKPAPLASAIEALGSIETLRYPVYVNAHSLQKTDPAGQHRTFYDEHGTPNPAFTESIHDVLLRECGEYRDLYDTAVVFDGDTIEFITQCFYRATVSEAVRELVDLKRRWLSAVAPRLERMPAFGGGRVGFPEYNHGLVTFLTTRRAHLGICNSGTLHVNLTLPTRICEGRIADKDAFARSHLAWIHHIQLLEPLFAACYGTADVFSLVDPAYSLGSLRLSRSRYVSLQSFDATQPVNGKLLLGPKPDDVGFWYNRIADGPYFLNATIGYDINFNKFKNHGVEIRFFDWFPEHYLADVIHVFILLGAHSLTRLSYTFDRSRFADAVVKCVRQGFAARLTPAEAAAFLEDLGVADGVAASGSVVADRVGGGPLTARNLLQHLSDALFDRYADSEVVRRMAPHMNKRPVIADYNREAHRLLVRDVFGPQQEIVIRCEAGEEARAPLTPSDVHTLLSRTTCRVSVETSATRCFSDAEYRVAGATIVPRGYWQRTRESLVLGLKAIEGTPHPSQTLMHFAHCFKGQEGAEETLRQLAPCRFIDYEFMRNEAGARVLSFCAQSGKIGCYLALMAYAVRDRDLPPFHEERYRAMLASLSPSPSILLIGHGTAGSAAKAVIDGLGMTCTVWNSQTMKGRCEADVRAAVCAFEVVIHAIRLPDGASAPCRFLLPEDVAPPRKDGRLKVICDISCDLGNPRNTLPIYTRYTSTAAPVQRLGGIALIALPHLPSLEPAVSTKRFSEQLLAFLPVGGGSGGSGGSAAAIEQSERVFHEKLASLRPPRVD